MKQFSTAILFCIVYNTCLVASELHIQIIQPFDALPCWASGEKLIELCKTFLTSVQEYTSTQLTGSELKVDDNIIAAQVAVDASLNACQNILNVSAALKLATQNNDQT